MKIYEIIKNNEHLGNNPVKVFENYIKEDFLSDIFLLAVDSSQRESFLISLMTLHTPAFKTNSNIGDIPGYYNQVEDNLPKFYEIRRKLKEWVDTENEIKGHMNELHECLQKFKPTLKKYTIASNQVLYNNTVIQHYETVAKTGDKALPAHIDLNTLPSCISFTQNLNKLFTTEDIINRFTSFAWITIHFTSFQEVIVDMLKDEAGPKMNLKEINSLTNSLSIPFQRLTRLLLLVSELRKKDTLKLFDPHASSLNRKLIRLCKAIDQLQKSSEHEVNYKRKTLSPIDRFFTLLDKTFIPPEVTSNNIRSTVSNQMLFSVISAEKISDIKRSPEEVFKPTETSIEETPSKQEVNQISLEQENELGASLIGEALTDEKTNDNDIVLSDRFLEQLEEIEHSQQNEDAKIVVGIKSKSPSKEEMIPLSNLVQTPSLEKSSAPAETKQQKNSREFLRIPAEIPFVHNRVEDESYPTTPLYTQSKLNRERKLSKSHAQLMQQHVNSNESHEPPMHTDNNEVSKQPVELQANSSEAPKQPVQLQVNDSEVSKPVQAQPSSSEVPKPVQPRTSSNEVRKQPVQAQPSNNAIRAEATQAANNNTSTLVEFNVKSEAELIEANKNLITNYNNRAKLSNNNKLIKIAQNWDTKYTQFIKTIENLPSEKRVNLQSEANKMLNIVTNDKSTQPQKLQAIAEFEIVTKKEIPVSKRSAVKIGVAGFIAGTFCAAICGLAGAGIGILAGIWMGPGAALTAALGIFAGVATGWSIGVAAATGGTFVLATGLITFGLYKRNNEAGQFCKDTRNLVNTEAKAPGMKTPS